MVKTSAVVTPPINTSKPNPNPVPVNSPAPPDFGFYLKRAEASSEKGDLDQALVDYGKAIEMKPDSFEAYLERGLVHANKKAFELAATDLSKAVDLNPKSAAAYANRGDIFEKKGDAAKAKADYQKATQIDPNIEPAKSNLAKIVAEELRLQREADEARKAEELKKAAEAVKKVAPEFVDLGQINVSTAPRMTMPTYPAMALRAGIQGKVRVDVTLDEDGNVTDAKAVEGHQFLRQLAPIRVAPASNMARASSIPFTPPEAFTPNARPTVFLISATSCTVAPPLENPVEVFTKSAPAFFAARHARTFSSSVNRAVSIITLQRM
jgi:tetratricopeptide (TPR) repeat protein